MTPSWKQYCIGKGAEIGGSSYRRFDLDTINIAVKSELYDKVQMDMRQEILPIDIEADASEIPVGNNEFDFVIASHVLEHLFDPIGALFEWERIIKPGGILYLIIPHKERTFDKGKERTPVSHLIDDYTSDNKPKGDMGHVHFWITEDILALILVMISHLGFKCDLVDYEDTDTHSGDGFTIILRKREKEDDVNAEDPIH